MLFICNYFQCPPWHKLQLNYTVNSCPSIYYVLAKTKKRNPCCSKRCIWAGKVIGQIIFSYMECRKYVALPGLIISPISQLYVWIAGDESPVWEQNNQFLLQVSIQAHIILIQGQLVHLIAVMVFQELMYNWKIQMKIICNSSLI